MVSESKSADTQYRTITMDNIPISMENHDLKEFCSRFGKVNSITRSTSNRTRATIEFGATNFLDYDFYDNYFQSKPFTPVCDTLGPMQNGQFLSNILNSYNSLGNATGENRNVTSSSDGKDDSLDFGYLICTYCYCCAEFQCERCQSPYCSEKCQRLDWLSHKKNCTPKLHAPDKHTVE